MTRYFFHTEDGRCLPDEEGVELPDLAAVRHAALMTMAEMSLALREEVWRHKALTIRVPDQSGLTLMTLDLTVTLAAALTQSDAH